MSGASAPLEQKESEATPGGNRHLFWKPDCIGLVLRFTRLLCEILDGSFAKRLQHINRAAVHHVFQCRQSFDESL